MFQKKLLAMWKNLQISAMKMVLNVVNSLAELPMTLHRKDALCANWQDIVEWVIWFGTISMLKKLLTVSFMRRKIST